MNTEKEFSGKTVPSADAFPSAHGIIPSGEKVRRYVDILSDAGFKAATMFAHRHPEADAFEVTLYGSLAATGKGHLTDVAIIDALSDGGRKRVDIVWEPDIFLPYHPNGMKFTAKDSEGNSGAEWTNTGITLGEAGLSLISDVNVEDDYVEFILNGNAGSFQVKRVTELKCEFLSGKTIFEYEEMKNLSMDVSGYVKYDIDYPEGWTVEFDGTKMSVTAPAAPSEWNQTPFDESGLIKIWL